MKYTKLFILTALASFVFSLTAFAGTVTNITVDIKPDVYSLMPGQYVSDAEPDVTSNNAILYSYSTSSASRSEMKAYKYEIVLMPSDGNEFSKEQMKVRVNGASSAKIETLTSTQVKISATTYPYYRLTNVRDIEENGEGYEWRRSTHAKKYNVAIWYEDDDGNEKKYNTSTTDRSIKIRDDWWVNKIAVQAISGSNDTEWQYLLPSEYVNDEGEVDLDISSEIKNFSFPYATAEKKKGNGSSGKSSSGSSSAAINNQPQYGWIKNPNGTWFKNPDGTWPANQWMTLNNKWYFFDQNGYLVKDQWILWNGQYYCVDKDGVMYTNKWTPDGFYVGSDGVWQKDKSFNNEKNAQAAVTVQQKSGWIDDQVGRWYRNADGSYAKNAWQLIDGRWYFFNESGYLVRNTWIPWNGLWYYVGADGAMYVSRYTPDGYYVGADGVWR